MNSLNMNLTYFSGGGVKRFTTAGTTISGNYKAILFCRNSQLTSLTCADITNASKVSSKTSFAAGFCFSGNITKVIVKGGALFLIS